MFKDCIGAIDGTHVRASVPQNEEAKYIGRNGYATQNIMINITLLMPDIQIQEDMHVNYKYKNQVKIVIASMSIHNYISKVGRFDEAFNRVQQESYNPIRGDTSSEVYEEGPSTRRTSDDDLYMAAMRDIVAQDIITLRRRM
uniref:DDE Tnp4 domain-containing protein n=1 Tax=Lactuca sativa TaxID=4236 RepID=A0A9R1XI95_LACSA|nr:hypothetical protein LSAT_V11C400208480 [Lactuca sativa]